jgi:hypothetical protein
VLVAVGLTKAVVVIVRVEFVYHWILVFATQVPVKVVLEPAHTLGEFRLVGAPGIGVTVTEVVVEGLLQVVLAALIQAAKYEVVAVGLTEAVVVLVKPASVYHWMVLPEAHVPVRDTGTDPAHMVGALRAVGANGIGVTVTVTGEPTLLQPDTTHAA